MTINLLTLVKRLILMPVLSSGKGRRPGPWPGHLCLPDVPGSLGPWHARTQRRTVLRTGTHTGIRHAGGRAPWPSLPPACLPERGGHGPGPMAQDLSSFQWFMSAGGFRHRKPPLRLLTVSQLLRFPAENAVFPACLLTLLSATHFWSLFRWKSTQKCVLRVSDGFCQV